ncbi:flavin monoamine oxidase family protein [Aquimarina macrocephali]|uniref:flavin monoamine oxidase family protein n=1 Tax=Aquimarina macrocephali TaxID=666563 RepID=UPI0004658A22|nr:FAD-dependent oxidoreductase [Aquimarina macrocephali]
MKSEVLIIGAGLTGLLLAYKLKKSSISFKIIEARSRIGGRIHTILTNDETPIEMGATWIGIQHQELLKVLEELKLPVFEQFMKGTALFESLSTTPPQQIQLPSDQQPSYRIQGGTIALINTLASSLTKKELILNEKITGISYSKNEFEINTANHNYHAHKVVSTVPPMLLVNTIQFNPSLPDNIIEIANNTHTWMGDAIKFGISYKRPFWKENKYSGTVFSNVGPITELYDHSDNRNTKYALKGFLQNEMHLETEKNRKSKVIHQLQKLFGNDALEYTLYKEKIWRKDSNTFKDSQHFIFPHQNNGHSVYQNEFFDDNLFIAGAETAIQFGGYMEGAVKSAQSIYQKLKG